jgi:hypothetical protein
LQEWNKKQNMVMTPKKPVPKTNVEQTKNIGELYLYLYSLGTLFKEKFQKSSNLHATHVHMCTHVWPMCTDVHLVWTMSELKLN